MVARIPWWNRPLAIDPAAVGYLFTKLSLVTKDVEIVQVTQKFCTLVKTFKRGGTRAKPS